MPMKYSGDNLQFPDNSIQSTAATGFGFKNRIINGDMRIDQRNAGASVTASNASSTTYTLDRWYYYVTQASKFTIQQNAGSVTPPTGFTKYLGITSSSSYSLGASDLFEIAEAIEGFNVADFGWGAAGAQTITVSFWVRSSLTGTFGGSVCNGSFNRSYPFSYTISAANTWEQKTVTIAGDTTGTWATDNSGGLHLRFGLGASGSFVGTANTWAAANYVQPSGTTSVVGTNGATFYITGVQLEKGSTATSFDYRPYGTELALCQRYAQLLGFPSGSITASIGRGTATGSAAVFRVGVNTTTPLRASPSISFTNLVCGVVSTGTVSFSSISTIYFVSGFVEFDGTLASSNGSGGQITTLQTSAGGTSYMLLSSEL